MIYSNTLAQLGIDRYHIINRRIKLIKQIPNFETFLINISNTKNIKVVNKVIKLPHEYEYPFNNFRILCLFQKKVFIFSPHIKNVIVKLFIPDDLNTKFFNEITNKIKENNTYNSIAIIYINLNRYSNFNVYFFGIVFCNIDKHTSLNTFIRFHMSGQLIFRRIKYMYVLILTVLFLAVSLIISIYVFLKALKFKGSKKISIKTIFMEIEVKK